MAGNEIASESDDASTRDGVLGVATDLGNRLRTALGDGRVIGEPGQPHCDRPAEGSDKSENGDDHRSAQGA